jgi:glycosyltransferase involved in cell wall biosynthesis
MAVQNGQELVAGALESILGQTYSDLEVVVVDDGSTDDTAAEVTRVADDRVSMLRLGAPSGDLAIALDIGVSESSGDLIGRMDADDVSLPGRIERQLARFRADPDLGMLGTWVEALDREDVPWLVSRPPCDDEQIRFILTYRCPFHHPSMMLRRSVLEAAGGYRPGYRYAEDYDLWRRMIVHAKGANLPEVLLKQRYYEASTSGRYRDLQNTSSDRISVEMIGEKLGKPVGEDVVAMLREHAGPDGLRRAAGETLFALYRACSDDPDYDDAARLKEVVANEIVDLAETNGLIGSSPGLWALALRADPKTASHRATEKAKDVLRGKLRR